MSHCRQSKTHTQSTYLCLTSFKHILVAAPYSKHTWHHSNPSIREKQAAPRICHFPFLFEDYLQIKF
uniref:Uncharacterized protein n=1 Tax=Aegilops tauschii subsp. strangulata TaxID=200361 RepID=A0A453B2B6_AEGTS